MMILAVVFPWSTSVTIGLLLVISPMILTTYSPREVIKEFKRPACALPMALVGLGLAGTAWASEVPWSDRLHALEKLLKLLWMLPLLLHFRKTSRATSVFTAYVLSNLVLLAFSFLVFFSAELRGVVGVKAPGVPLKNYIDQSQAFALLAVIFLGLGAEAIRNRFVERAIAFVALSATFFANLAFINIARTAFLYIPVMLALVILRYARGWRCLALSAGLSCLVAGLWATSPNLQSKLSRVFKEVSAFEANAPSIEGEPAGGAERLEFWRKSIGFVRLAPIIGHGTGSTKELFASEAAGKSGIEAMVVDNPHNQTLAVAIQWGLMGCLVLYAMWGAHLWLFRHGIGGQNRSLLAWMGLVAVVQNIVSSLINSHLFDFYQGWLYLFAVAIASGQLDRDKAAA
ncbi:MULTISPECIES: O-antigen ligase family protein [unclassified Bradyrhizobium]|uniref:O-antigen ligase family protein n=1 Tax=unclassified Bradyrhizobium TaxID=2631580 RepID=UPI001FF7C400|nr:MULTISPECIES: O-antigen ligase family protein [unclassified Bradyrhizobium]MCK1349199.1 O-antigen ligase family protein [Bradyrhizobium sp. CW11]MCK1587875.1 O-antigen ligase family protein [Bradyrhizobium sp. 169]